MELCGFNIGYIIYAIVSHFGLGFCVGLLVYWLTQTTLLNISSRSGSIPNGSQHHNYIPGLNPLPSGHFIHNFSLCLALSSSVWFHILQDYTLSWF